MDLQTIEKIIDELAKGKESLKFNDDSIFVKYGAIKLSCSHVNDKLKLLFTFHASEIDNKNPLHNTLKDFQKHYDNMGIRLHQIQLTYFPKNEEETRTILKQIFDNYS